MAKRYIQKLLIVVILVAAGIVLEVTGLLDADKMLNIAREYTDQWWLFLVLILLQIIMYTFALAGSFFLWIVAPLYPPVMATVILAAGGTLGGVTAYLFSKRLTDEWVERIENSRVYKLLRKQGNFFTLFSLRVLPGFPHSLVNYSSGILNVKLIRFIPASILGLSIKSYVYSKVIYNATTSPSFETLLDISVYGPLLLLAAISLLGVFINYKLASKNK